MGNTNDFSKAQPGDKLWSLRYGEVLVKSVGSGRGLICSIGNTSDTLDWWDNGKLRVTDVTPDLYWSKPEIIAPEKPKRIVAKEVEVWVNFYATEGPSCAHYTEEAADRACMGNRRNGGKAVYMRGVMEVVEED